jgi:hypothetical protein
LSWTAAFEGSGATLARRKSNREGAGARVRLPSGGRDQAKEARASGSVLSSNDPRVLFGLGQETVVEEIEIRMAGGCRTGGVSVSQPALREALTPTG